MKETVRKRLEGRRCAIFRILERELKDKPARHLNFSEIAREVGCSRKTVTYHYRALRTEGLIGVNDGKMYLIGDKKAPKISGQKNH